MNNTDKHPNGLASYLETHFEVVGAITIEARKNFPSGIVGKRIEEQGTGGLYELAEELADRFEQMHAKTEWDGEFFDTIEEFLNNELNK